MTGGSYVSLRRAALALVGLAALASVCAPAASAQDKWSRTALRFDGWQAEFRAEDNAAVVSYGRETIRIVPIGAGGKRADNTLSCTVAESEDGTRTVRATFSCGGREVNGTFVLSGDGTVELRPGEGLDGISIEGPIRYGVLPGIFLEDVIYDPAVCQEREVCVPSENLILGFLEGGGGIVACTWPEGRQKVTLRMPGTDGTRQIVDGIDIALDGRSAFITVLAAGGIWDRIELKPDYLERDVELPWKRPFDARWKTELLENDVKTTFEFRNGPESEWRPMLGFFDWPVRFDGDKTVMHLAKKIPPEGSAFVWPLDGHRNTPLEFVRRTPCAPIFAAIEKRQPYPRGPRNAPDIGYTHCWGTAIMKRTIYQYGFQDREQEYISNHVDYCLDYVAIIQTRSMQFRGFIARMSGLIDEWTRAEQGNPATLEFLEAMKDNLRVTEEGYQARVESGGRKTPEEHIEYSNRLGERLKELVQNAGTEYYPEEMMILSAFNGLSAGSDEDIPAGFGTALRNWFTSAAYGCMDKPEALPYAQTIRKAIREKLKCRKWETTGI